jgi:hypothetical protein
MVDNYILALPKEYQVVAKMCGSPEGYNLFCRKVNREYMCFKSLGVESAANLIERNFKDLHDFQINSNKVCSNKL